MGGGGYCAVVGMTSNVVRAVAYVRVTGVAVLPWWLCTMPAWCCTACEGWVSLDGGIRGYAHLYQSCIIKYIVR